ncbi:ubiquitin carboxyl-terminal hydrolase MINDY-3 homolog [Coccinella septempunctata]|uniref:ubiquitin carboxyl-terminal hydrolase MINDY-3 homolog n=1 Tax=Coccinella septempunctata TaxID=41139 RepID=UPI001D089D09|nr:ubiquitin carboxyl-terminal hydrolase MINDY-3 homolog [Coccinella septempunctata]
MAEILPTAIEQELLGIKHLLWGNEVKPDIFKRWSQGFHFSENEPSALEQISGGPCAILAPVQGFILKNFLLEYRDLTFRDRVNSEIVSSKLIDALIEILEQCKTQKYHLVCLNHDAVKSSKENEAKCDILEQKNDGRYFYHNINTPSEFHEKLKVVTYESIEDVRRHFIENIGSIKSQFGILLFLYSVIFTKGVEQVKIESESTDPLIDETYGYGSQSLINLMITGRATTYVWDNEQDVGGLRLKGIAEQGTIGFITLMEHLRFCTVGSFYKNPKNPVWVVGSDTHLTVLFSDEFRLVSPETKSEEARRVFKSNDPDGNNFIDSKYLGNILETLGLCSEQEYVDIMRRKLDSESLGIILLNAFMEEFFPKEETSTPDMFRLVHYNGLASSNVNGAVKYQIGSAILLEMDLKSICESNPVLTVLQTKWPNIEVSWEKNVMPSLN